MSQQQPLSSILIVGGGTAGWLTALYVNKVLPNSEITLVESEEIGILGAGEGTVPNFVSLTDFLDIPVSRLIKDADATVKTAVKFTNWNNDGKYFYHPFDSFNDLGSNWSNLPRQVCTTNEAILLNYYLNDSIDHLDLVSSTHTQNKVPFMHNDIPKEYVSDPIQLYTRLSDFALHFNAVKLAAVLKEIAIERGVRRIEGKVTQAKQNDSGDIVSVDVDDQKTIKTDFVFDCSGYARLFIGKLYKSEWVSHSSSLTVNAAVPFFIQIDDEEPIPAYTEATAMKYGWMWSIPTRSRYGCGYVFNKNLISADEARLEVQEYFQKELTFPREFSFDPGYYKTPWVNNCVAIGLSSGFIEPLEATSIWLSTLTLQSVLSNILLMETKDRFGIKEVNNLYVKRSNEILDFIYFHYMSGRKDTEFWKHYNEENASKSLQSKLESWKHRVPMASDDLDTLWSLSSWMYIARGKTTFNRSTVEKTVKYLKLKEFSFEKYTYLAQKRKRIVDSLCVDHRKFLDSLDNTRGAK